MIYSEKYGGYVADVPNVDFIRCDGRVFFFDQINSANYSQTNNSLTINGGWSPFAQAIIDTDKELTVQMESSQFTMELFELAYATDLVVVDKGVVETGRYAVETGSKVTLPFEVQTGSVKIYPLEEATTAAAGKFSVSVTASTAQAAGSTVITFAENDVAVGDYITVSYRRRAVDAAVASQKSTTTTARGELFLHYPIYSAGIDCTEAAIKAYVHLHIYRVRVSETPGFDNSWKSAGTNSLTFTSLDSRRPDKKVSEVIWEPLDANGNLVNKSDAASVDWN